MRHSVRLWGMRMLIGLFLSLVLAIGSVSMAVAHGQMPMGQAIALCTDAGAVTVVLDANGNPTSESPHLCPDCLSGSTAFTEVEAPALPAAPTGFSAIQAGFTPETQPSLPQVAAKARGPPVLSV